MVVHSSSLKAESLYVCRWNSYWGFFLPNGDCPLRSNTTMRYFCLIPGFVSAVRMSSMHENWRVELYQTNYGSLVPVLVCLLES